MEKNIKPLLESFAQGAYYAPYMFFFGKIQIGGCKVQVARCGLQDTVCRTRVAGHHSIEAYFSVEHGQFLLVKLWYVYC